MRRIAGFTLVELLTAMAVMSLVLVLVSQMVGSALSWAGSSRTAMNCGEQARAIWQRLAFDLNARVDEPNIRAVKTAGGNDSVVLLSDVRNVSGTSRFTRVTWQVAEANNPLTGRSEPLLFRVLDPVAWDDDPSATLAGPVSPQMGDLYSGGTFRLEVAFVRKDGSLTADPPVDPGDIDALVVGAAVLDASVRTRLSDAEIKNLATRLPDAQDGRTPVEGWQAADLGGKAAPHARFYQQTFFLNRR